MFSLCVEDFGCRYVKKEDAEHLAKTVGDQYPIKVNWDPDYYLGVTIKWDYEQRIVELLMPGYV